MSADILLIVGLGNPGSEYRGTRHNAGADFVEALARDAGCTLQSDSKFFGLTGRTTVAGHDLRLLIPTTYMNRSGQSVAAICNFFKLTAAEVLVVHDELDLPPGVIKLKKGGGHGGHNGLRDIHKAIGADYHRLRIGIGHPGDRNLVVDYVLKRPSREEDALMREAIGRGVYEIPVIIGGDLQKAMNRLH